MAQKIESAYTMRSPKNWLKCMSVSNFMNDGLGSTSMNLRIDLSGIKVAWSAGIDEMQPEMIKPHWMAYMAISRGGPSAASAIQSSVGVEYPFAL